MFLIKPLPLRSAVQAGLTTSWLPRIGQRPRPHPRTSTSRSSAWRCRPASARPCPSSCTPAPRQVTPRQVTTRQVTPRQVTTRQVTAPQAPPQLRVLPLHPSRMIGALHRPLGISASKPPTDARAHPQRCHSVPSGCPWVNFGFHHWRCKTCSPNSNGCCGWLPRRCETFPAAITLRHRLPLRPQRSVTGRACLSASNSTRTPPIFTSAGLWKNKPRVGPSNLVYAWTPRNCPPGSCR